METVTVMPLLSISIGIGLVVSLLFSELFGLAVGGMVVPGYFALYLDRPWNVAATLGAALVSFSTVRALAGVIIIYGRRRTVLMILVGYLCGAVVRTAGQSWFVSAMDTEATVIGYIIPGLIAIWMDRQGVLETLIALLTGAVVVRLVLIIFLGAELLA